MLRFNKRVAANDDNNDNIHESNLPGLISQSTSLSNDNSKVISIDTISLDRHSRLTLTKRVKDVFPIEPGDRIAVYKNTGKISNELIFEVQRRNSIVDVWVMKRNTIGVSTTKSTATAAATTTMTTTTTAIPHNATIKSKSQKDGYYYNHHDDHLDQNNKNDNSSSLNIMLIDDEPDLLVAFESILSAEGYNIEAFSNSKEALKRFLEVNMNNTSNNKGNEPSSTSTTTNSSSSYYSLVITDIRMPGLNGIQLYQILKALSADVKILFISALDAAQEVVSALPAVRPSDIIQKPVEAEPFIKKINEAIIS